MTRVVQPFKPEYRIEVRSGDKRISDIDAIWDKTAAQKLYASVQAAFPGSRLTMSLPGGTWVEATTAEIDRVADVNAALALAAILEVGLTRIDWTLAKYEPGEITGYARSREVVAEYAKLLGKDVAEKVEGERTRYVVKGVYRDVAVDVYCNVKNDQPASADKAKAVA
ncbi:hypothetical protein ABGB18_11380 [Nonomuraea sp. B12E4]|uniref:hypothetical protein n=1 Tax=Nonomuraea sp. B12E4 TaxID=3153564 RepID=UPI00325DA16B